MFPTGKRGLRAEGASPTRTAQSRVPTGPVIRNGVACSQAVILPCNEIGSFSRVSQIECKHPFLPESEQNEAQGLCISVCVPEKLTEDAAPSSSKSAPRSCCEFSLRTRQHSLPLSRPVGLKLCKHAPSPRLLVARPVTARPWERLCPPPPPRYQRPSIFSHPLHCRTSNRFSCSVLGLDGSESGFYVTAASETPATSR